MRSALAVLVFVSAMRAVAMHHFRRTLKTGIVVMKATTAMNAGAAGACEPKDFTVDNLSWQQERHALGGIVEGRIDINGRITKNCAEPSAAEVTLQLNDKAGKPIAGTEFDVIPNIAPGASYWLQGQPEADIHLPPGHPVSNIGSVTATVIGVEDFPM